MEDFVEFQGKSLDEAIRGACAYFDAPREKLEIDIIQDAKNGIFGLVGARKAIVRARRAQLKSKVGSILGREGSSSRRTEQGNGRSRQNRRPAPETVPDDIGNRIIPEAEIDDSIGNRILPEEELDDSIGNRILPEPRPRSRFTGNTFTEGNGDFRSRSERRYSRPERQERSERVQRSRPERPRPPRQEMFEPAELTVSGPEHDESIAEGLPATPFSELDHEKLERVARETAGKIVSSILGETPVEVTILENRVDVRVDCGEDSGLLIGREGQTLAALQYITSRIVSRIMEAPVRVQFDVGDYRERQDDRLRELALALAERVRTTGRPCSTRPMSSYHRRLVHMALQDSPDVQTRSSGEGPLKRVIIQRRRPERNGRS